MSTNKTDNVNHPKHYEGNTSLECIEAMEVCFGTEAVAYFCLCNAFKYMWRYKHKNGEEDINKAKWYLDWVDNKIKQKHSLSSDIRECYFRLRNLSIDIINKLGKI